MAQTRVFNYVHCVENCESCGTQTVQPVVGVDPLHLRALRSGESRRVKETIWCPACASQTAKQSLAGRLSLAAGILFRESWPAFEWATVEPLSGCGWRDPTCLEILAASERYGGAGMRRWRACGLRPRL